jgi:hypothetical protein
LGLRLYGSKPARMRSLGPAALAFVLLAGVPLATWAQPAPAPTAEPAPSAAPAAPAAPGPGISATPAPPTAAPLASPAPTATPTPSPYHYVVSPPSPAPGQPAILEIDMLEQIIHPGAPYSVRVKTSLDVTTINVSAMGATYGMQAAGPGLFATDGQVPDGIPFFLLNRSYGVTVTAQTADGRTAVFTVNLRLEK